MYVAPKVSLDSSRLLIERLAGWPSSSERAFDKQASIALIEWSLKRLSDMKYSVLWMRGAREMLNLPAWSEQAERAYFDAVGIGADEDVLRALRWCLRNSPEIPMPQQLRKVAERLCAQFGQPSVQSEARSHD